MAFIRCLSNPEGLYIWHDISRKIYITCAKDEFQANKAKKIPAWIWYGYFEKYKNNHGFWRNRTDLNEYGSFRGLECGEDRILINNLNEYRCYIKYDGWKIYMYPVTFHYIANNVIKTLQRNRKKQ